ncbi:ABC transporter permease, partial [bacterium]|nr:ABC transporter permease [bacterium]
MVSRVLLKKLFRDMWGHKGGLSALLLIVMIGIGVFDGTQSVYRDLETTRARYYSKYRLADFTVNLKRAPEWTVEELRELPNVLEIRGRAAVPVMLDLPGVAEPISGTAFSVPPEPDPSVLNGLLLRSGTWFSHRDAREVIVNNAFAKEHGLEPGDRLKALLLDKQHDLLIVGTAMSPEFVYLIPPGGVGLAPDPARFGVLYLPEDFLQEAGDLQGAWNQVIGLVRDDSPAAVDSTLKGIERRLEPYGVLATIPRRLQASARFVEDELTGLRVTSTVMPAIFLGVSALLLHVLM